MLQQMDTPALWLTGIIFLLTFLAAAFVMSRYEDEDIAPVAVIESELEFERFEPSLEFCEWWTPDILDHYADIEKWQPCQVAINLKL